MNNQQENLKVVIIAWNRLEELKITVNSLLLTVPNATFYIFDNASTEKGMHEYYETLLHFNIHVNKANLGWGAAINQALGEIELNDTDMILLSNNDVAYFEGWYDKSINLYSKYPQIGILGLWKHTSHGVKEDLGDLIISDQSAAVAWLLKPNVLKDIGPIAEHGICTHPGGNGEDVDYCIRVYNAGYWIANPKNNLAIHLTGY